MFGHSPAQQKATAAGPAVPDHAASSQQLLGSQSSTGHQRHEGLSHGLPLTQHSNDVHVASSHRPKPRQPQRKGKAEGKGKSRAKENGKGQAQRLHTGRDERPGPDADRSTCVVFSVFHTVEQGIDSTTAEAAINSHGNNKGPSKGAHREPVINTQPINPTSVGRPSNKEHRRPTGNNATIVRRVAGATLLNTVAVSAPDGSDAGRKSGRLREKGPTTYTAKGEIIRAGKRVNDEIHEPLFSKRARYET